MHSGPELSAVWLRFRAEFRGGWRGTLAIGLLVGVVGTAVLTVLAGARRTTSSVDRFRDAALSPHVYVNYPPELDARVRNAVARAPGVEAVSYLQGLLALPASHQYIVMAAEVDGGLGRTIERGRLLAGRFARPDASDEVALSENPARLLGLRVGDTFELLTFAPEQLQRVLASEEFPDPAGPTVRLRVVGVYRSPFDLGAVEAGATPVLLTRGFVHEYANRIALPPFRLAAIRLRGGDAGATGFMRAFRRTVDDRRVSFEPATLTAGVGNSLDVLGSGLLIFAVVAGLAGFVAVGQALSRRAMLGATDDPTLRALGMTRWQRVGVFGYQTVLVAGLGAVLAVLLAIAASPVMPIGLGRQAEPDPGIDVDATILGAGCVAVLLSVLALGLLAAWRAERSTSRGAPARSPRASTLVRRVAGLRPTVSTGMRFALERGSGRTMTPVRSVLVGAIVGIAGITAATMVGTSLDHLVTDQRAWGWNFDTHSSLTSDQLTADKDVAAFVTAQFVNLSFGGRPLQAITFLPGKGRIDPTIVDGRAPDTPHEIALGAKSMNDLHLDLGSTVRADGRNDRIAFRVVGQAVFPSVDDAVPLADGALLTPAGLRRIADPAQLDSYNRNLVRFAPGVNIARDRTRLARLGGDDPDDPGLAPRVPAEIERLRQLDALPAVLAGFLGLMGVIAIGHGLVSAVRRRRRDLALLKTLGFRRGQISATIAWQATTVAAVAIVVGLPVGILIGRWAWRLIVGGLGVASHPEIAPVAIATIAIGALVVANATAYVPGRIGSRLHASSVLRNE